MKYLLYVAAIALPLLSEAQSRTISGTITSAEDGSVLPGVNVLVKGTTNGVSADAAGHYLLTVTESNPVLVISFIGLETQEVEVANRTVVDVSLKQDVRQLTEVVITAQGIQTEKRALGYSVSTVSGENLTQRPQSDVARLLTGQVPGVSIASSGGVSGSGTKINIRGYTSISGSTQPLFVVDGVPFNTNTNTQNNFSDGNQSTSSRFLDLDPNNIEDLQVLKGLSATVLYGEQGRNGVILITTKNGAAGRKKKDFEVSVFQSVFANKIASLPDYSKNYGIGNQNQYGLNFGNWGPSYAAVDSVAHPYASKASFPEFAGKKYAYKPYNGVEDFFRTGIISTTSLNMGASKENLSYNANFSYVNEEGFTPGNTLKKLNGGVGINSSLTKKLLLNTTFNYAQTEQESPPIAASYGSGTTGSGPSIFGDLFYTPQSIDLMGLPFEDPVTHASVYYRAGNDIQNPLWTAKYSRQSDDSRRFFGKTSLTYNLLDNLSVMYRLGLDTYSETQSYSVNKGSVEVPNGIYRTVDITNTIWNHDVIVNYSKDINDALGLTVVAGANAKTEEYRQDGQESTNQLVFGFMKHSNFTTHSSTNSFSGSNIQREEHKNTMGLYGQVTVDYNRYLYLNLAGRNDWYSTLEKANHSIFYPSASVSFIPTTAFSSLETQNFNYMKLRLGYGTSAKSPDPYSTRSILSSNARAYLTGDGSVIPTNSVSNTLGNLNLKPELQSEYEAGVETRFFGDRVGFDLTLFSRVTKDLITNAPLDPSTGYTSTSINIGEIQNRGIELAINTTPLIIDDFRWNLIVNYYKYESKVTKLGNGIEQIQIGGFSNSYGNYAIEGKPYNVIQGSYWQRDENGKKIVTDAGDYLDSDDIKIIGNPNPDYTVSFINSFSYKGLALGMQWDYRHGGDIYSMTANTMLARGITQDTDFDRSKTVVLDGVKGDGTPNDIQTTVNNAYFNNYFGAGEGYIYDGTTVRLREVSLSYALPLSLLSKTPFKAVSLQLLGQNLWYRAIHFPEHVHFDTDQVGTGVGNAQGLDMITGPSSRRYGVSVRATF